MDLTSYSNPWFSTCRDNAINTSSISVTVVRSIRSGCGVGVVAKQLKQKWCLTLTHRSIWKRSVDTPIRSRTLQVTYLKSTLTNKLRSITTCMCSQPCNKKKFVLVYQYSQIPDSGLSTSWASVWFARFILFNTPISQRACYLVYCHHGALFKTTPNNNIPK